MADESQRQPVDGGEILPEWDPSQGPPRPSDVVPDSPYWVDFSDLPRAEGVVEEVAITPEEVVAPEEIQEAPPPAAEADSPYWVDFSDLPRASDLDQPPSVRIEGPRKIVVEPAESFNSISQLENPEEIARSLPERLDETPTAEEMAYYRPYIKSDEQFVEDREELLYQWNRTTEPSERLELLEPWAKKYMPRAVDRAQEESGFAWGTVRGLAWAAAAFDNVTARPARTMFRTLYHYAESPMTEEPSEEEFAEVMKKSWDESHGDFAEGEDLLKKIYKMGRMGTQLPGVAFGGEKGEERLKALDEEANQVFQMGADTANWLGYTLGGAVASVVPGGTDYRDWAKAREEAHEQGSTGGHEFIGFMGQMLVDPFMFFKMPSLKNFGGVDMTDDGFRALEAARSDTVDAFVNRAVKDKVASGERVTDDWLEEVTAEATETATISLKSQVVEAADVAFRNEVVPPWRKSPQIYGVKSLSVLEDLKNPVYTHVVNDILDTAGIVMPGKRGLVTEEGIAEAGGMYAARAEKAWSKLMEESIRRKQVIDGINMEYVGKSVDTLEDVFTGAVRWVDPPTAPPTGLRGRVRGGKPLTKDEAFKAQGLFHSMDNLRTRMMLGLIRRFPYLENIRRTGESMFFLEKAQPMAEKVRKIFDPEAGEWRIVESETDVLSEGQAAARKWKPKEGVMHQAKFRRFERRELQRQQSNVVDNQKLAEFIERVKKITGKKGVPDLALLYKGLGRHIPAAEEVIIGVSQLQKLDELLVAAEGKALDDVPGLPENLRAELEGLAQIEEFAEAAVHISNQMKEVYSADKLARAEGLKNVKSNIAMLEKMLREGLSDTYRKEAEFAAFMDSSHIVDEAMNFKAVRKELQDMLKTKRWENENSLQEVIDMVKTWRGEVTAGIDRLTSRIPFGSSDEVFAKLREEGVLPKGNLEGWKQVRGNVREGFKSIFAKEFGVGNPRADAQLNGIMAILDARARSWAKWNRVDPVWESAWYARAFRDRAPVSLTTAGRFAEEAAAAAGKPLFARTPEFQSWFGDSKVVDEAGEPLVVYHGTFADFAAFDTGEGMGAHFGTALAAEDRLGTLGSAEYPPSGRPSTISAYLNIRNPYRMPDMGDDWDGPSVARHIADDDGLDFSKWSGGKRGLIDDVEAGGDSAPAQDFLRRNGYDGIVYRNAEEGRRYVGGIDTMDDSYIVFDPNQIKSTQNLGAFDPSDPRILYARGDTQTPEFKRWFADSKVVDEAGEPLVVYHGTTGDFDAFKNPYAEDVPGGGWNMFSEDANYANKFAPEHVEGAAVVPVYLSVKNPLDLTALPARRGDIRVKLTRALKRAGIDPDALDIPHERDLYQLINRRGFRSQLREAAQQAGYDGISFSDVHGGLESRTHVAFDPTQIKSTQNVGAWGPDDPRILYAREVEGPLPASAQISPTEGPRFYSALEIEVEAMPVGKLSAKRYKNKETGQVLTKKEYDAETRGKFRHKETGEIVTKSDIDVEIRAEVGRLAGEPPSPEFVDSVAWYAENISTMNKLRGQVAPEVRAQYEKFKPDTKAYERLESDALTVADAKKWIVNRQGVKKEEIDDVLLFQGFDDGDLITKEEILEQIRDNRRPWSERIEVGGQDTSPNMEMARGGVANIVEDMPALRGIVDEELELLAAEILQISRLPDKGDRGRRIVSLVSARRANDEWEQIDNPPAAEAFRELVEYAVEVLEDAGSAGIDNTIKGLAPAGGTYGFVKSWDDWAQKDLPGKDYTEITFSLDELLPGERSIKEIADADPLGGYHFGGKETSFADVANYDPNIFMHLRFDTVEIDGKKVLRVLEVQSDLHQKVKAGNRDWKRGVPRAPYSKSWRQMAARRIAQYAADNGFDEILVPGSAARDSSEKLIKTTYDEDLPRELKRLFGGDSISRGLVIKDPVRRKQYERHVAHLDNLSEEAIYKELVGSLQKDVIESARGEYLDHLSRVENHLHGLEYLAKPLTDTSIERQIHRARMELDFAISGQTDGGSLLRARDYIRNALDEAGDGQLSRGLGEALDGMDTGHAPRVLTELVTREFDELSAVQPGHLRSIEWALTDDGVRSVARELKARNTSKARDFKEALDELEGTVAKITPQKRDEIIEKGLPSYAREPSTKDPMAGVFFEEGKAVIGAFEKATFTEMVHEIGHIFRRDLPESELEVATNWIRESMGDRGFRGEDWSEAAEEVFAQAFVKWLKEGDLPEGIANQGALKKLFEEMKTWLKDIYYAVTGGGRQASFEGAPRAAKMDVKISDDIKGVFERLLDAESIDKSPFAKEYMEAAKAMDAATGLAQVEAYTAYRSATARMLKAAGMEDVDVDATIKASLSGNAGEVTKAKAVIEDAMKTTAGRVPDFMEPLAAPVFKNKAGMRNALARELVQRLSITPDDAGALISESMDAIMDAVSGRRGFSKNSWSNYKKSWDDVVREGARQYIDRHPHMQTKGVKLSQLSISRKEINAASADFEKALRAAAGVGSGALSSRDLLALVRATKKLLDEGGLLDKFDAELVKKAAGVSRELPSFAKGPARRDAISVARQELRLLADEARLGTAIEDPALREAAEIAALKGAEISEATLDEAKTAVDWLGEQIVDAEREVKDIIMDARRRSRTMARANAAESFAGVRGKKDVREALERGIEDVEVGVEAAFDLEKRKRLKIALGEMSEPRALERDFTERMDELLNDMPETADQLRTAAEDLSWDLRTPGEVWSEILTYGKQARAAGDFVALQREVALEAFRNDRLGRIYEGMTDGTKRKVGRLMKDRRFYGVSRDVSPEVKKLAKEIGMVGDEELFVYTKGKKGDRRGGFKTVREAGFTDKDIKDALQIVKMLDDLFEAQLKKMQDSGKFTRVDPEKQMLVNDLIVRRDSARTLDEKNVFQDRISEIMGRDDFHIKWSKEDFLDRVDVASYVPHVVKSVSREAIRQLQGNGLLPAARPIMFEKFRTRASILDDINDVARNDLASEILYHNAVKEGSPAWQPGGAFEGLDFESVRTAALMGDLEKQFGAEAWDEAIKWARVEAKLNDQFDFFETNFNIIVERYVQETDKAASDRLFINDMRKEFPVGDQIAKLVDEHKTWSDAKAREYGYSRISKTDTIEAMTGIKLPSELRSPAMQEWIVQQLARDDMSTGDVVAALRTRGINVDRLVVESFRLPETFLPTPAAEYLRWMNEADPASNSWFFGFIDGFHSLAKGMATIASLAHINMNVFGNYASISQTIGLDLFNPRHHLDAMAICMRIGPGDQKWFQKMGLKHEDALIKIGSYELPVKEWRERLEKFGVTEAPLSRMMLDDIGSADRTIPGSEAMWRSILGAGGGAAAGATAGGVFGGPVGAVAGGFLGQYVGSVAGEISRHGWKRVWNDETSDFIKAIEEFPSTKRGPKKAIRYFGERSIGMTIGASVGGIFGPPGAVAGAIAGLGVPAYMRMMAGLNQSVEMQARVTLAVAELSRGKSFDEAAASVDNTLRNYSHLTPFERNVLRRVFFFYTWDAGNIRFQIHQLRKSPRQAAVFMHFMNGIYKGQFSDGDIQAMPEVLRWRVVTKTGPMRTWMINGLPQQAFIETMGRAEGMTGMLSRLRPEAVYAFELFADKQSIYYGKGWEEINNVKDFKDASPFFKWLVGFPVKKDDKTGKWIPAPQPTPVFDKDGDVTGYTEDYRSLHPEVYYTLSKLPGWRTAREQNALLQSTFANRILGAGRDVPQISKLERAINFVSGHRGLDIDFPSQAEFAKRRYLKALTRQVDNQNRALFYDITRANERLPVFGGPLDFPTRPEDDIDDLPLE